MRNVKNIVIAALIGVFALSATGCSMVEKTESAVKGATVAKIGSVKITKGQVDERMTSYINEIKSKYGENYKQNDEAMQTLKSQAQQTLDSMVVEEVLRQKAKELNLIPEDAKLTEQANQEIANTKKTYFGDDQAKFDEAIKSFGLSKEAVLPYFKDQIVLRNVSDNIVKDVKVEDKDVSDYYEANKSQYTTLPGANLYHILVKTEDEAKSIKAKLDKGEKFEDLAKQYGTDGTKDSGGSLGYVEYDTKDMDQDFMAAAKTLKENEISGPVKTQFGYHIIKAANIQKDTKVKALDEVKDQLKEQLLSQKKSELQSKTIEDWKKAMGVKTYEKNL